MTDYTSAVDALAKFEYAKLRSDVIERFSVDPDQIDTWDELDPSATLSLKEDALDSILEIETHLETIVLANILEQDSEIPAEVFAYISARIMNNELDLLTQSDD